MRQAVEAGSRGRQYTRPTTEPSIAVWAFSGTLISSARILRKLTNTSGILRDDMSTNSFCSTTGFTYLLSTHQILLVRMNSKHWR